MHVPTILLVIFAATVLAPRNIVLEPAAAFAPSQQDGATPAANSAVASSLGRGSKVAVNNADDTLSHWSTCAMPDCHPGGKGVPVSTNQTINNADPSVDGASMMLMETIDSTKFFTNILWPYKARGCDSCTQIHTDFWAFPVSSSHVGTLEYDAFVFDATRHLDMMWGVQWNQREGKWQIWNQATSRWIDTNVTTGPAFGAWNHLQFADHRVIGDTTCGGTECLYYDSMTLNGSTYELNLSQPAGPIHPGWHSVSGFQFQLDATPVNSGTATLTEYIDKADMWAN